MIEYHPHPTDPNLVVMKVTKHYIAKHSDEDLKAAVLAEREACALLAEGNGQLHEKAPDAVWAKVVGRLIRARGNK